MKQKNIIYLVLLATAFTACDRDVNNKNLTPSMVYIVNSGVNDVVVYNVGKDHPFRIGIYKSGALHSSASVGFEIMTGAELDAYNAENETNFVIMPESCYGISEYSVSFSEDRRDVSRNIEVLLKPDAIENLPASTQAYVLPLKIVEASIEVNEEKSVCIVKPEIKTVLVRMTGLLSDKYTFPYPVAVDIDRLIGVELDVENEWEVECTFDVDGDYVDIYNAANGTSFSLLPSNCYSFPAKTTIAAPESVAEFTLEVNEGLIPAGRFILPIRLVSVSDFEVSQDASLYLLELKVNAPELARTGWSVTANTDAGGGYEPYLALDGNSETFWHCNWSPVPPLPHSLTIDMGQEYSLSQIGLLQRAGWDMFSTGEILVGEGSEWTKVAEFTMPTGNGTSLVVDLDNIVETRYFRVNITGSRRPDNSTAIAEITAYGY